MENMTNKKTEDVVIVKYGEIVMRGKNRNIFVSKLISAIHKNIDALGNFYINREQARLIIEIKESAAEASEVIKRASKVFGVIGVCPGIRIKDYTLDDIKEISLSYMKDLGGVSSFKVKTKRSDKRFPMTSNEISADVGGYILENMPELKAEMKNPEVTLNVEIRNHAYVYTESVKGYGGLPYGSSGKAVSLLSGGIDSPVAAWMMAKRGLEVSCIYFHSPPYTSERAKQKVIDLAKVISEYTGGIKLYIVPFTEPQLYLLENVPEDKLTIFLKRAMLKTAQAIAEEEGAMAIITGDSVGQVASQTMQGIHAIDSAAGIPVLRPLAGMDKQEIVDIARKIGTFDISARPFEDCCTIFVAKHPETRPKREVIEKIESNLEKLPDLLSETIRLKEIIEV